jgi:hypothetical protein
MSNPFLEQAANINLRDVLNALVERLCIVDYGIVKKIPTRGVLQVEISAAKTARDIKIITCVMANYASVSTSLEFVPNIGDKVLVLYPAKTHEDMFDVDKTEAIIANDTAGYNLNCGIALLVNQFRPDDHKNFIQFNNGEITLKVGYVGHNHVILTTKNSGQIYWQNDNANSTIEANGDITVNNPKCTVQVKADGNISVTNQAATVTVDPEGNFTLDTKDGKSKIHNNLADLYTILKESFQILNASYYSTCPLSTSCCVPNQLKKQETDLDNLMQ